MNRLSLIVLTLFVGAGGGFGLIVEADLWLDPAWLDGTPFSSFVIPGYILLFAVAGSNLAAGVMLWLRHQMTYMPA